jgi:hypothetical protein
MILVLERLKQEELKFKVNMSYLSIPSPAWAAKQDPVSKQNPSASSSWDYQWAPLCLALNRILKAVLLKLTLTCM